MTTALILCTILSLSAISDQTGTVNLDLDTSNSITAIGRDGQPFAVNVSYHNHGESVLSGYGRVSCRNCTDSLPFLNFTDYAPTLTDFQNKYPCMTIEAKGLVVVGPVDGDMNRYGFATFHVTTGIFADDATGYVPFVNAAVSNEPEYYVAGMQMAMIFEQKSGEFWLKPYTDVYLRSDGPGKKIMRYEYSVSKVTFNTTYC